MGVISTVTRAPGGLPARRSHGHSSVGEAADGLTQIRTKSAWLVNLISEQLAGGQPAGWPAQLAAGRVLHGEQAGDELAGQLVAPDLFRRDVLGLAQCRHGFGDLAALGVGAGHVDRHPGAPFGGQPGGIHGGGDSQRTASVAEFDRDGDLVQADVG